jgi:hypothetical protein
MAHRGFDGQGVFQQGFGLGVFPQQCHRFVTCHAQVITIILAAAEALSV